MKQTEKPAQAGFFVALRGNCQGVTGSAAGAYNQRLFLTG